MSVGRCRSAGLWRRGHSGGAQRPRSGWAVFLLASGGTELALGRCLGAPGKALGPGLVGQTELSAGPEMLPSARDLWRAFLLCVR